MLLCMMMRPGIRTLLPLVVLLRATGDAAPGPVQIVPHSFVTFSVLGVRSGLTETLATTTIETGRGMPGRASVPLGFPLVDRRRASALDIEVSPGVDNGDALGFHLTTSVWVDAPDGSRTRLQRERNAEVSEGGSFVHLVYEDLDGNASITAIVSVETRLVPDVVRPQSGHQIRFQVFLLKVEKPGVVPLEENELRTFDGSPVNCAFKRAVGPPPPSGQDATADGSARPEPTAAGAAPPSQSAPAPSGASPSAAGTSAGAPVVKDSRGIEAPKVLSPHAIASSAIVKTPAQAAGPPPAPASETSRTPPGPAQDPGTPPGAGQAADTSGGAAIAAILMTDEMELTLTPRKSTSDILSVDVDLSARLRVPGGLHDLVIATRRTQAVTNGGSFELTVGQDREDGGAVYRFVVRAMF
jgi:hypothetical protein